MGASGFLKKIEKTLKNPKKRMFSYIYEINGKFLGAFRSVYYLTDAAAASVRVYRCTSDVNSA
ncbi:hypothetical protein BVC71_08740 [Marivivens niveibacter]|uniref:Uncharacterized protein n=1 Tax=Marivivens niveibacter TaxID=1930667 RepID=A0A251WZY5_9RHOB|nr:hypothetical protein BVC71_08740 [Marivivens niveibacter]